MKFVKTAIAASILGLTTSAYADNVLMVQYYNSNLSSIENKLENSGHVVDLLDGKSADSIYNALSTQHYDQVFILDVTTTNYMSANDLNALSTFHSNASSMVIDTQSYNYTAWNTSDVDGLNFLNNGIYLGVDHAPSWTRNANAVLDNFGINSVTGSVSGAISSYDASSPLFNGVNPLNWNSSSYGIAPTGLQSNGQTFDVLASNAAGDAYISASFNQAVSAVPEPSTYAMMMGGLGLVGLMAARRKKQA